MTTEGSTSATTAVSKQVEPPVLAADVLVRSLEDSGVDHVFGLAGTTIMHVLDALSRSEKIRFISARHEQMAGFMADGYARATGTAGVCLASRGPGAANLTIALDNAYNESSPVVAVIGQVDDSIVYRGAFEEMDLTAFFAPITKQAFEVHDPRRIAELTSRAISVAETGRRRPVALSVPLDVLTAPVPPASTTSRAIVGPSVPAAAELQRAAQVLAGAQRPVIIVGGGGAAPAAQAAITGLSERLGAPVVTTWHRKDAFPNSHPAFLGVLGFGAFDVTEESVRDADVVIALGCRFSQFTTKRWTLLPEDGSLIHVDSDADELGRTYVPDVALCGDSAETARALTELLPPSPDDDVRSRTSELRRRYLDAFSAIPGPSFPTGVSSYALVHALEEVRVERDPIFVQDAPTFGNWLQRYLNVERPQSYYGNAGGAMGWGVGAAMGIQLARPDERVVVVTGDGSFWMVAQDLETAVRENIPVVFVIPNNFAFGNIRDRQLADHDGRHIGVFYDNPDFAAFARLVGAHGERVEHDDDLPAALHRAFESGLPAVVDVIQHRHEGLPPDVRPPLSGEQQS